MTIQHPWSIRTIDLKEPSTSVSYGSYTGHGLVPYDL